MAGGGGRHSSPRPLPPGGCNGQVPQQGLEAQGHFNVKVVVSVQPLEAVCLPCHGTLCSSLSQDCLSPPPRAGVWLQAPSGLLARACMRSFLPCPGGLGGWRAGDGPSACSGPHLPLHTSRPSLHVVTASALRSCPLAMYPGATASGQPSTFFPHRMLAE